MGPQKLILVVEDNMLNRAMLCDILSSEYQVLEAENGQQALDILKERKEDISLILLDIVMPVMDGYTFLSIMKAEPAYSSIPVIVTTQSDSESDEVSALSHGATDFVAKPYKPLVILNRVASIINLRETAAMVNLMKYDRLTGLYSKEFFYQRIRELLNQHPEREYDIICSDVENFKLVNDIFGVPAGDRLLCMIARMFIDRVGDHGICGRFNADQFACLLERQVVYTDDIFVEAGEQINALSNVKNVVMKWGIYAIEDRSIPVEQMCDRAMLAAGSIKGQYQKHFAEYDDTLRGKLLREQAITDSMETALAEEQFVVYLQPKYRIADEQLAGAEALVRWNHPEWGFQSPAEFIPLFEKNGFITKLDQYVWDRTCAILREWDDRGYPAIPVSVNVSRSDVYLADLADILLQTVQRYDLLPSRLHLEITESAYTENPDQIIDTVNQLRELGFVIEMDDFGSGYSSLNMLNKMPLDILKLDMKFIQSETAKPVDQGILRFIMSLARWMNLSVVAEGVETAEQLSRLREIGCDYAQGYYFGKPMPRELLEPSLRQLREIDLPAAEQSAVGPRTQVLLVADEDAHYRSQVRQTFGAPGGRYQVVEAEDGKSALACIASYENRIAAVILSLTLSDPDGFSVLDVLQRENAIWRIPIVATAAPDQQLEEMALELGADDFAGKPHTQKSLLRRVRRAMDLAASHEQIHSLRDAAYQDDLTGLLNRRGFNAAVESLQKEDLPCAVCLYDLDRLKQVNDSLGHEKGDQLIQKFAALLGSMSRRGDILSRFGGDEFLVIAKRITSAEEILQKGEELCRAYQDCCRAARTPAGCSVGIAVCETETPMSEMIRRADEALYRAKRDRKGGCCLWEASGKGRGQG